MLSSAFLGWRGLVSQDSPFGGSLQREPRGTVGSTEKSVVRGCLGAPR